MLYLVQLFVPPRLRARSANFTYSQFESAPDLAAAGIKALKIEGRMKSASYVDAVVSAYRLVVDAVSGGNEDEIQQPSNRWRTLTFY